MQAGSEFFNRVKELARQFFSALCQGSESSEEQRIGVRHAVSANINDVESSFLNSFNLIGLDVHVPERVTFKLCMTVYKCLHGIGQLYLSEMCRPISSEAGCRHFRSTDHGQLLVPRCRLMIAGRRAFSCAGPSAWNSLPPFLRDETLSLNSFKRCLKCFLFATY